MMAGQGRDSQARINVSRSRIANIVRAKVFNSPQYLIVEGCTAQHGRRRTEQYGRPGLQNADGAVPLDLYFDGLFLGAKIGET